MRDPHPVVSDRFKQVSPAPIHIPESLIECLIENGPLNYGATFYLYLYCLLGAADTTDLEFMMQPVEKLT